MRWFAAACSMVFVTATVAGDPLVLPGTDGKDHHPLPLGNGKPTAIFFVTTECPISNKLIPEMKSVVRKYSGKGIRFLFVNVEPKVASTSLVRHAEDFGLPLPILLDRRQALARKLGVTRTPEVALVLPGEKLAYRGRINDAYVDLGKPRAFPRHHDLREAIDAVLARRPVARAKTEPVGCLLPPLD